MCFLGVDGGGQLIYRMCHTCRTHLALHGARSVHAGHTVGSQTCVTPSRTCPVGCPSSALRPARSAAPSPAAPARPASLWPTARRPLLPPRVQGSRRRQLPTLSRPTRGGTCSSKGVMAEVVVSVCAMRIDTHRTHEARHTACTYSAFRFSPCSAMARVQASTHWSCCNRCR